jgi:hypothetical protein
MEIFYALLLVRRVVLRPQTISVPADQEPGIA